MKKLIPFLCVVTFSVNAFGQSLVQPNAKVKKLAQGMKFTEGPVWLPDEQKLIFSDIPNSMLMQWKKEGGLSKFRKSESANGNILDLDGNIISCQHGARNVIRIDKKG
ncbi:SMP-30/gluconolactonase/LRE family protein, partial [bacterium]|nr:SMP-30/gluconolactonase/LRE family protein [bacterium]